MKIKVVKKVDKLPAMQAALENIDGTRIQVGVTGEHAWLAGIHEYGCTIPVTPKMRAYLRGIGVNLKKSTTQIKIPERSFLRAGFDDSADDVVAKARQLIPEVLSGRLNERDMFELIGRLLQSCIKDYAVDLSDPKKSTLTLSLAPGKTNPLIQTGDMVNAIAYEVIQP